MEEIEEKSSFPQVIKEPLVVTEFIDDALLNNYVDENQPMVESDKLDVAGLALDIFGDDDVLLDSSKNAEFEIQQDSAGLGQTLLLTADYGKPGSEYYSKIKDTHAEVFKESPQNLFLGNESLVANASALPLDVEVPKGNLNYNEVALPRDREDIDTPLNYSDDFFREAKDVAGELLGSDAMPYNDQAVPAQVFKYEEMIADKDTRVLAEVLTCRDSGLEGEEVVPNAALSYSEALENGQETIGAVTRKNINQILPYDDSLVGDGANIYQDLNFGDDSVEQKAGVLEENQEPANSLFPYSLDEANASIDAGGGFSPLLNEETGDNGNRENVSIFAGEGENANKEVHIHNEIPAINIEFSGNIEKEVDFEALLRNMQKRIKEEMEAGSDFSYSY